MVEMVSAVFHRRPCADRCVYHVHLPSGWDAESELYQLHRFHRCTRNGRFAVRILYVVGGYAAAIVREDPKCGCRIGVGIFWGIPYPSHGNDPLRECAK